MIISNIGCILAIKYVFAGFEPHWTQTLNMKTIYLKHPPKGDKCCDPWHVRGLEYNYYATLRIHLMRVYGTCVIRLIHHYACECIIKELGASILGAIHHEQAGSGCWAVQNKVNCKGLYARKLDTLQTIVLITLVDQNNTRGRTTIPMLKMKKKHYLTLRRTISHFSPFYLWIVTWGASAILTPRQHHQEMKLPKCPARLEWFELDPTTNFIFLLSLVCALVLKWIWWQQYNILIIIYEK